MTRSKNFDLRLLVYFQKTAEIGNITKAAENLNVAQPTLSKALQLFESHLLVAEKARINARGTAVASRAKTGRGQVTAPIFILVPQVKLRKRLDLARDAERVANRVPRLIVEKWVER